MSKRPANHLIVSETNRETGFVTKTERMTLAAFMAAYPDLADQGREVLRTGRTGGDRGIYVARGAGDVR